MKVRGDNAPGASFTLEALPNRPGWVRARFYPGQAQAFTETRDDGETIQGWAYDEYTLILEDTGALETDVAANLERYVEQAKAQEAAGLSERVAALESGKADQTAVDELTEALDLLLSGDTGEGAATT